MDTPEGVELELYVTGPAARGTAWAFDFFCRCVIYLILAFLFSELFVSYVDSEFVAGFLSITAFVIEWLYPTLFEGITGTTPGKKLLGLKVVQDDGTPLTFSSAIIRNFLRAVDFLPMFYVTGLVAMNSNKRFQRLGDLAGGTLVIYMQQEAATKPDNNTESLPLPGFLKAEDQLILVRYAERCEGLSSERQIELANTLAPMTGQKGQASVNTLKAWANWITRGQSNVESA